MWLEIERQRSCKPPHAGANPAVGSRGPDGVADGIGLSEGPGPGSTPGRDIWRRGPASVPEARQSSKLQDEVRFLGEALTADNYILSSGCAGFARDFAKVADQVRFLTRILTVGGYDVVALHATL